MAIKIVLIGSGAVGTSFVYSALNQGLAANYVLIDAFAAAALGNALDLADTAATIADPFSSIKAGDYKDVKDADIVVITAGRPQRKIIDEKTKKERLETRLEMTAGNACIMRDIALNVKKSGFSGVTVIASNPVDVMTRIYQEITGFKPNLVIGSGTTLDSSRLRRLISEKINVNAHAINAYVIGEHGDSSVAV
jgi:L-lactate dehydrogenase